MNRALTNTALAIAVSVSTSAFAQNSQVTQMEPVIVVGGISPVAADEFGRSNTIITREQIKERGYATVQQALEAQPGISINGTSSTNRQIRIRGGEGRHTLVLIDGVRAAAGDGGFLSGYILRGLDTAYVERIEVIRGPQSVPFGTDAASGVVNIVTREGGKGWNKGGKLTFGDVDRKSVYVTQDSESSHFSLNVSNSNDRGFDYSGSDGERDGRRWESIATKGEFNITNRIDLGFSWRAADAAYNFDGNDDTANSVDNYVVDEEYSTDLKERSGKLYVNYSAFEDQVHHRIQFDQTTQKEQTQGQFGLTTSDLKTEVVTYRLQTALDGQAVQKSDQVISALAERREDSDRKGDGARENSSAAIEYRGWVSSNMNFQAGIRRDDNSQFENETTWNVSGAYFLANDVRFHASVGRSVVNPEFFTASSNPDLVPEKNVGYDVGFEMPLPEDIGKVDITYFNESLKDKIFFETPISTTALNASGESDRQGAEVSAVIKPVASLGITVSYTYTDATNPDGEIETRRPRNEVGIGSTWRLPDGSIILAGNVRYVRGLFDQQLWVKDDPRVKLSDFTVVNLSATHKLSPSLDLTARITNALDEEYSEVWGYATRGRAGFFGLSASW